MAEATSKNPNSCVECGQITPRMGHDLYSGFSYCEKHDPDLIRWRMLAKINYSKSH